MQYVTIEKLRKIIVEELSQYDGAEPILLNIESEMLQKIFFTSNGCIYPILAPILSKVDFSNISFDGFDAYRCDFSNLNGVKINPQTIKNKNLELSTLAGVEFTGSFDDVKIEGANFTGSKGAKINPQTIKEKNITGIIASGVEFIGSFDNVLINSINFKGSFGAKIDPQTILNKVLICVNLADVEFVGDFSDVLLSEVIFDGSKGAVIDPSILRDKKLGKSTFGNVQFCGKFDEVSVSGSNFKGSFGAKIDPQKIFRKNFYDVIAEDVTFGYYTDKGFVIGGCFDLVGITGTSFKGSKGAQINPQRIEKLNLKNIIATDVEFIGSFEGTEIEGANFEGSNYQEIIEYEKSFRQKIKKQVYAKTYKDSFFDV